MRDLWQKNRWHYLALLAIFLPLCAYQIRFISEYLSEPNFRLHFPFAIRVATRTLATVAPEGLAAGLQPGDHLTAINGQPFVGFQQITRAAAASQPNDIVTLGFRRGDRAFTVRLLWRDLKTNITRTPAETAMSWMTAIVMPVFSLAFAFFVAAMRPRDPMAWLFLMLLVGFSQIGEWRGKTWEDGVRPLAIGMRTFMVGVWPAAMLLLGVYFGYPFPSVLVRRVAIAFVAALLLLTSLDATYEVGMSENTDWTLWLTPVSPYLDTAAFWASVIAIGGYFALMQYKHARATLPDVRRKLALLLTGTYTSMTPIFIYIMVREVGGIPEANLPLWFRFPVHLALLLFPISLAYVIIVHRAVDVRVVVRSGLQYTLARGGVRVLQALFALAGIYYVVEVMQHGMLGFWSHAAVLGGFAAAIVLIQIASETLFSWIDRRFFRDAYSAEYLLAELAEKVRTVVDRQQLFHIVAERISTALHVPQIAFFLANGERYDPAFAYGGLGSPSFTKDAAPVRRLCQEREPVQLFLDDDECWINDRDVHQSDRERLASLNAQLLLPLEGATDLIGFVTLSRKRSEEPFSKGDMRLLRSVGLQTGLALENSRLASSLAEEAAHRERSSREIEIAREVQQRLFPQHTPRIPGIEILGTCRPALAAGGDYYDYFEYPNCQRVGLAVGDVSGKGVGAAIMMATVQASLRTQVLDDDPDLAASVSRLNQVVYEASTRNRFATLFYGQFDRATGRLVYVNAGHNRPVIIRRDGEIERLSLTGIAIGLKRHFAFRQAETTLAPGDLLVAFTDGLSESMNADREEWGEDELAIAALELSARPLPAIVDGLIAAADRFAAGAPQHDDMTLIVLRSAAERSADA